jgi:hypothetical protein
MTNPAEPSTPSGSSEKSTTKATDHELQKYDIFTRYGHPMQLVMPPFMQVEPAIGMALYSARAILHGRGGDVWEMAKENFL